MSTSLTMFTVLVVGMGAATNAMDCTSCLHGTSGNCFQPTSGVCATTAGTCPPTFSTCWGGDETESASEPLTVEDALAKLYADVEALGGDVKSPAGLLIKQQIDEQRSRRQVATEPKISTADGSVVIDVLDGNRIGMSVGGAAPIFLENLPEEVKSYSDMALKQFAVSVLSFQTCCLLLPTLHLPSHLPRVADFTNALCRFLATVLLARL